MMTKHNLFRLLSLLTLLLIFSNAYTTELRHDFTLNGMSGETGTGYFIWDDEEVANGNALLLSNIIHGSLTVTGAGVPGGTQTFSLADWTGVFISDTPNFATNLNFDADNGVSTLTAIVPYTATASDGGAWTTTLIFTPGATISTSPTPVPLLDMPALIFTIFVIVISGLWQINRQRSSS